MTTKISGGELRISGPPSANIFRIKMRDVIVDNLIWVPNIPPGMTLRSLHECNQVNTTANTSNTDGDVTWGAFNGDAGHTVTVQTDGGAPFSPSNVIRQRLASGSAGGEDGDQLSLGTLQNNEVYCCVSFKLDSAWENHSSQVNKVIWFISDDAPGGGDPFYLNLYGADSTTGAALTFQPRQQGDAARNFARNQGSSGDDDCVRGTWYLVELHLVFNTAGNSDGELHCWIDGTKTHEYTDVKWVNANPITNPWSAFRVRPIWGGTGGTLGVNNDQFFDRISVYYK